MQSLRSIKELEYSLTLRTLDTNAANIVAISRYQYVRLLPARVVSVISISYVNRLLIMLLRPRAYARGCSKLKLFVLSFSFSLLKIKIILRVCS